MWIVGLSRFVIVVVLRPFVTRRARTAAGRRGAGPVLGVGGAQEEQGLGEARFVILQDSHIDLVLFVGFFDLL